MHEPNLPGDEKLGFEARRKILLEKLNNLSLAAVDLYATASDRNQYVSGIRGLIKQACELGAEFERNREGDGKQVERPNDPNKAEPEQIAHDHAPKVDSKLKAKEAAAKL